MGKGAPSHSHLRYSPAAGYKTGLNTSPHFKIVHGAVSGQMGIDIPEAM